MSTSHSSDLQWRLIKKNNSFAIKRDGFNFSTERYNLLNKNTYRQSGLIHSKALDMSVDQSTGKIALQFRVKGHHSRGGDKMLLKKGRRRACSAILNSTKNSWYRRDLAPVAVTRFGLLDASLKPVKSVKAKKVRGNKK